MSLSQPQSLELNLSKLYFIVLGCTITILGFLAVFILPERYMFDAYTIALDRYNEIGLMGSYPFSMWFYEVTGLNQLPFYIVAWIQIPIIFLLLYKLGIPNTFKEITLRNILVWMGMAIFSIYLGFPSKEFINYFWIFIIAFILTRKLSLARKIIWSTLLLLFFGWFYREYFILMPLLAFGIYLCSFIKIRNKAVFNISIGIIILCFMSLAHGIIKGSFISESSRHELNIERNKLGDENAATMILSPVEPDTFHGEVFGIVYGFFSVNLPIAGLRFLLKPQVVIFVTWQVLMFLTLMYYYSNALKNRKKYSHELWVFHLLFAYFLIQGIFEPDLGSAVKHKLGVFPLIWLCFYYDQGFIKRPKTTKKYVLRATQ